MSENTGIAWTDATLLALYVLGIVTAFTQGNSVGDHKAQVREVRECLQVMGIEIPSATIAATLAGESITGKHINSWRRSSRPQAESVPLREF